jgi:hypothetical protein
MKTICYWLCFTLVAIPNTYGLAAWAAALFHTSLPAPPFFALLFSFSSPVPQMLAPLLPRFILVLVSVATVFLLVRRVWLTTARKERGAPWSFYGFPRALGYIGAGSFVLAFLGLALSIAFKAGSGVPAGMLLLPAVICIPWAFFLTELLSFRKRSLVREA